MRISDVISGWRRSWRISTVISTIILTALTAATAAGFLLTIVASSRFPIVGQPLTNVNGITNFILGAALGSICVLGLISARIISDDFYDVIYDAFASKDASGKIDWPRTVFAFVMTIIVFCVLPLLAIIVLSISPTSEEGYLGSISWAAGAATKWLRDNGGGPLGFFVSAITLSGFILTVRQLKDFNERIMSFEELIERVNNLSKAASNRDPLHIISYTPALGYLAQPEYQSVEWMDFLRNREHGERRAKLIALRPDELEEWHNKFVGRRTRRGRLSNNDILECNRRCAEIKLEMGDCYIEVGRDTLPGWYAFFTSRRAIVVTPLFLPIEGQVEESRVRLPKTVMIGYETSDRLVIDHLMNQFEYIADAAITTVAGQRVNGDETVASMTFTA